MPAMPVTETRCALRSSAEAWNSSLTSRSSRSRPTKGASRPDRALRALAPGDDPHRAPELDRLEFALQLVGSCLGVDDRPLAGAARGLADQHLPGSAAD